MKLCFSELAINAFNFWVGWLFLSHFRSRLDFISVNLVTAISPAIKLAPGNLWLPRQWLNSQCHKHTQLYSAQNLHSSLWALLNRSSQLIELDRKLQDFCGKNNVSKDVWWRLYAQVFGLGDVKGLDFASRLKKCSFKNWKEFYRFMKRLLSSKTVFNNPLKLIK